MRTRKKLLKIFLTLFYGSIISKIINNDIITNLVQFFSSNKLEWINIVIIFLGILFIIFIIWSIISTWKQLLKRNLIIIFILLIVIFILSLTIGIYEYIYDDTNMKDNNSQSKTEYLVIFIIETTFNLFAIIAVWLLIINI